MIFPDKVLNSKVILFGEIHGTSTVVNVKVDLIKQLLDREKSTLVFLERPFSEAVFYKEWSRKKKIPLDFKNKFSEPKTALYTQDELKFLDFLHSRKLSPPGLEFLPVDISFDSSDRTDLDLASKKITNISDEDQFDLEREQFIIERIEEVRNQIEEFDCVILFAGNMHTSKMNMYYSLSEEGVEHISTSGMYLSRLYEAVSIFCYPVNGEYCYQSGGKLIHNRFNHHYSSHLNKVLALNDREFKSDTLICNKHSLDKKFASSYDWTLVMNKCEGASIYKALS